MEGAGHEGAAVGGGEEAEAGEHERDAGHAEQLGARAASPSCAAEHVAVHQPLMAIGVFSWSEVHESVFL